MNWSYKTIHFALKKEGLLGAGFLDESEIEQVLNEYGRSGWELVSVLEVQDGIITIFKQPIGVSARPGVEDHEVAEQRYEEEPMQDDRDFPPQDTKPVIQTREGEQPPANTIGAIKIE